MARALRAIDARGVCCRAVAAGRRGEALLREICRGLVGAGYTAAVVHYLSPETRGPRLAAYAGIELAETDDTASATVDPAKATGAADLTLAVVHDLAESAEKDSLIRAARDRGGRALARLRIRPSNGELALLSVFASDPGAFTGEEAAQLEGIVHDLEVALHTPPPPGPAGNAFTPGPAAALVGARPPSARTRRKTERAMGEQLELTRSITDSAQDAIIMVDEDGAVTYWNRAAENIFGWTAEEILGQQIFGALVPEDLHDAAQRVFASFTNAGAGGAIGRTLELSALQKNGGEIPVELSLSSVRLRGRWQAIGIIRDITERKRVLNDLKEAKLAAEAAAEAKSMFLANVSHELRTPLNGIIGMTDLLLDTPLDRQQYDFARTVRRSGEILLAVINDILDFSKIGSGKLEFESIPFSVRACVEEVGDLLAQKAAVKNLELVIMVDHRVPPDVEGDPGRLRQVITNLVNNAIKFTEKGEVVVAVRPAESDDQRVGLVFEVEDTGIGIPTGRIGDLFLPFTQADASTTRRFGGTGLGLSIVKSLVERMGGTLEVESREGEGSVFRFIAFFAPAQPREADTPIRHDSLAGLNVLIVDDNKTNRRLLEELLNRWGCTIEAAASGADAIDLLIAEDEAVAFDFAILDFSMPGMDGASLAAAIKTNPRFSKLPLILLTSMPEYGDGARMREAGFSAYLTKPIKQSYLYDAILSVLAESDVPATEKPRRLVTRHTLVEARQSRLRILVVEDNQINQKVAARMLERLGYRCDIAGNGQEALDALDRRSYDVILMDCQMPVMDGFEATRSIRDRERDREQHTPIIATTAHTLDGDRERCVEAGMDGYISKPIDIEELADTLERFDFAADHAKIPFFDEDRPLTLDPSRIRKISHGDQEFQHRLLRLFMDESKNRRSAIDAALEAEDASALQEQAHALKGGAANIGADGTAELARRLQKAAEDGDMVLCATLRQRLSLELDAAQAGLRRMLDELDDDGRL